MVDLGVFSSVVAQLNHLGFYGFVLPWLLMFALVYGLIMRSKMLDAKPAGIVAMALAFFITAFTGIGNYFVALSGLGGMLLGALLIVVLFFALLGFKLETIEQEFKHWETIAILGVIGIIIFFVLGGGAITGIDIEPETMAALFMIVVVALAVMFITKEPKGSK